MDFIDGNNIPSDLTINFRYVDTLLLSIFLRYEAMSDIRCKKYLKEIFKSA